jgi:beta-1,4-mannosyl-glycoprotein beta-1,4-N-acetylglucosaminyltransferase
MKVVDTFIFYNELDLLKYRLSILDEVVDHFVIVEATHTFSGKEKPLIFQENIALFDAFLPKITHIIVKDFPYIFPNINYHKEEQWKNEHHQRNCISRGIDSLELSDSDIILISDLDEIPDPNLLIDTRKGIKDITMHCLQQDFYYYNLTIKTQRHWALAKILSYGKYKSHPYPQTIRNMQCPLILPGGWHMSYFGDTNFIQNKIQHFSHQELNKSHIISAENIENSIKNVKLYFNSNADLLYNISLSDNTYLPPRYKEFLSKYLGYKDSYILNDSLIFKECVICEI